jgi:NMD protein affecting ribosome stability and mRNA decay
VFLHKAWRRGRDIGVVLKSVWDVCPACQQVDHGVFYGHVLIRGLTEAAREDEILRRISNVAERARFTQPERRIVTLQRAGTGFDVRTTSQKLAHRIVRELEKAFGGRVRLRWSDSDGRLFATWDA